MLNVTAYLPNAHTNGYQHFTHSQKRQLRERGVLHHKKTQHTSVLHPLQLVGRTQVQGHVCLQEHSQAKGKRGEKNPAKGHNVKRLAPSQWTNRNNTISPTRAYDVSFFTGARFRPNPVRNDQVGGETNAHIEAPARGRSRKVAIS